MEQENIWERELKFPVEFIPVFDTDPSYYRPYDGLVNKEFEDFLESLDIEILHYMRFFLSPSTVKQFDLHADGFDDVVTKLNFVYCDEPSCLKWYRQIEDRPLQFIALVDGHGYRTADRDNCELVHTLEINNASPRLINTALLHEVLPVAAPRYCFTFLLGVKSTGIKLTWDKAQKIFKEYII